MPRWGVLLAHHEGAGVPSFRFCLCALVLYCRRTQFSGAPLIVQVFLASRVSMGPWRAAARGVAVEVLRFLVSGLGDKERCPVSFDWRAEDQVAYWREEADFCIAVRLSWSS